MKRSARRTITIIMTAIFSFVLAIGASAIGCGDINNDDKVNAKDILALKRHIVGIEHHENCDANGDGKINAKDILSIKRYIVGLEDLHKWETTENVSCTDGGSIVTACARCGIISKEEIVPTPGHNFIDGVCSRCGAHEVVEIESIEMTYNPGEKKYIIGEAPDLRSATLTVRFTDGTYETIDTTHSLGDVNSSVGYYCERLDKEISLYITDTTIFTNPGKQAVTVEFGGATCEVEFTVEDIAVKYLDIENMEDGSLILNAALTNGSVQEMKLIDLDARMGDGNTIGGFLITDKGTFNGSFFADEKTGALRVALTGNGKVVPSSNSLEECRWTEGYLYAQVNAPFLAFISDEISCYGGIATKDNIDALIRLALMRLGLTVTDEPLFEIDEVTGDMLIPAEAIDIAMQIAYSECDYNIEDSPRYDAQTGIYRFSDKAFGGYMPIYPTTRTYKDGIWTISVSCAGWDKAINFCINDDFQITEFDFGGHSYVDDVCTACGKLSESYYTKGLEYTLSNDGKSYIVTGIGEATGKVLVVPGTYNGRPVKEIGNSAFAFDANFTKVILPGSITSIGAAAFEGSNLVSVRMPGNLEYLGMEAFNSCTKLKSIELPGTLKRITGRVFMNCTNLEMITIGDGTEEISDDAFSGIMCDPVIFIPSSVKFISTDAFLGGESAYTLIYNGTLDDWKNIGVKLYYDPDALNVMVVCDDGMYDLYEIYER